MPTNRKRSRIPSDDVDVGPSAPKRTRATNQRRAATPGRSRSTPRPTMTRASTARQTAVTIVTGDNNLDSLFGDIEPGGVEMHDLTNADDTPTLNPFQPVKKPKEMLKEPPKDTSVKLSAFECVICMDAAKVLTLTCCGHMFCAQCLHKAMHTEVTKKACPMCRQRLDKPAPRSKPSTKAFFHLELKLRASKKSGKQPLRS